MLNGKLVEEVLVSIITCVVVMIVVVSTKIYLDLPVVYYSHSTGYPVRVCNADGCYQANRSGTDLPERFEKVWVK